jgi:putative transposase
VTQNYQTDLTDSQWDHIKDFLPPPKQTRRPRSVEFRQIVNGILFLLVSGCQWRMMPKEYPKWQTVYHYFTKWKADGLWFRIHETLRAQERQRQGKNKHPTAGAAGSQSVKTTAARALSLPADLTRARKQMERKRHILVDILGLMIAVCVTTACVQDRDGLKKLLKTFVLHRKKLRKIWVDGGYRSQIIEWVKQKFRFSLEVVLRSDDAKGFVVLPKRWIVERTFAWLNKHRRLSKDYERYAKTSETMIQIAMIRLMLRRIQPL